jgi:hypothetical protein
VERSWGPMNKNRIEGVAGQGERAMNREALVINGKRRRSGGRAVKECVLTWGRSRLVPERATALSRSEKSAEVVVVGGKAARPSRVPRKPTARTYPSQRTVCLENGRAASNEAALVVP